MNEMYNGLIRHLLTTVGGVLAAKGYIEAGQVEMVAGALATILGVVWSIYAKRRDA